MQFETIGKNKSLKIENQLSFFMANLTTENETFSLDLDYLLNCELLIIARDGRENIKALCCIYRKYVVIPCFFIVVKQRHQNKGIARKLMIALNEELIKRKYNWVFLTVYNYNPRAIEIYKKQGFVRFLRKQEHIYMVKSLNEITRLIVGGLKWLHT